MALKDFLCLVCIDEAHTVHQEGYFCPEFQSAVGTIRHLHGLLTIKCSIIVMLATFRSVDQDIITALLGIPPSMVMWLELSCQQIRFDAVCCGNPIAFVTSSMKHDTTLSLSNKTIIYTNSKMKAQGTLTDACETVLDYAKSDGELIPITGDDELQFKVFVMQVFAQNYKESAA
jgi:superfamily II DNA helicase RecQ